MASASSGDSSDDFKYNPDEPLRLLSDKREAQGECAGRSRRECSLKGTILGDGTFHRRRREGYAFYAIEIEKTDWPRVLFYVTLGRDDSTAVSCVSIVLPLIAISPVPGPVVTSNTPG